MPPGKPRYLKPDSYIFNRSAPPIAALPRATNELVVAYRIFSPGLDDMDQLDEIAASISHDIENDMCGDLMHIMGTTSRHELREIYNKSYAIYASEIKRMEHEEEAEAAKLKGVLDAPDTHEASEVSEQVGEERDMSSTESWNKDKGEKHKNVEEPRVAPQDTAAQSRSNKRRADDDDEPTAHRPSKCPRYHDDDNYDYDTASASDTIPAPYWLSRHDAQAALVAMAIRAKNLEATLLRLQDFYRETISPGDCTAAPIPTISKLLARADIQLREDVLWYIAELQRIMAGEPSASLDGDVDVLDAEGGLAWKRDRFDNAVVRGLIERVREFGARLADTERAMDEADRLREEFVQCGGSAGEEGGWPREMFLEDWVRLLEQVTQTVAHEAREYVSFRTMEAEWADKWAEKGEGEGEDESESEGSSIDVVDILVLDDSSEDDS